jgi:stage IV sporulation protein FB
VEIITLFGIVLIHELGHVAAAKSFGWKIREVRLLPFGGVAVVDKAETVPAYEEIAVALAGPLQNAIMVAFAYVMKLTGVHEAWWDYFIFANILIGLFNLLPIAPLDGGKLLQAFLSYLLPYQQVLVQMTYISLFFSLAMILVSLAYAFGPGVQLNLLIIGAFLLYSNWHDRRNIAIRHTRFLIDRPGKAEDWIRNKSVLAQPIVVTGHRKISEILRMFMREKYHLIYVLNDQGKIQGVFPEQRMISAYFHDKHPECAVSELFM